MEVEYKNGKNEEKNFCSVQELDELIARLSKDFPELVFRHGKRFSYRFPRKIAFEHEKYRGDLQLLHEVGHAICLHKNFKTDPERVKMEREAWEKARELCTKYLIEYDEDFVEEELETYRAWLYKKSVCKRCGEVRYQTEDGVYHCINCG